MRKLVVPNSFFEEAAEAYTAAGPEELICNYAAHKTGVLQPYEARAVLYRAD